MSLKFSVAIRNARMAAIESTVGTSGKFRLWSGTPPSTVDGVETGTNLATIDLPADWLTAPSNGLVQKNGVWSGTVSASGIAQYMRITDSTNTNKYIQMLVSEPWAANTVYEIGQQVNKDNLVYRCTTGGTSGASGPSGTGSTVSDGSVVWSYLTPVQCVVEKTKLVASETVIISDFRLTDGNA
jgi:hypothetical protein